MSVKIENIVETTDFRAPNKRVAMLEVHYISDKGYRGSVLLEKAGATTESITAAVLDAAKIPDGLIGQTVKK